MRKLSEEKPKQSTIRLEITLPTRETIIENIKRMFPTVEVKVVEEAEAEAEQEPNP